MLNRVWIGHFRGTTPVEWTHSKIMVENPNHGLKSVCDAIGTWRTIAHCYQTIGGSNQFCIGPRVGTNGLDAKHYWDSILANFCRLKDLLSWEMVAMAMGHDLWCSMFPEVFILVQTLMYIRISLTFVPLCLKQAAHLDI